MSPPILTDDTVNLLYSPNTTTKFSTSLILQNDLVSNIPGDTRTLQISGVDFLSNKGGSVQYRTGWVLYTPPVTANGSYTDWFNYYATNGANFASARVTLNVVPILRIATLPLVEYKSTNPSLKFANAIPLTTYSLSASDDLRTWTAINNISGNNVWYADNIGALTIDSPVFVVEGATKYILISQL